MSDGMVVKQAGPLALVEDGGRFGVRHLGVTQGGAADWISFRWANWLLGNPLDSAALEIVMGGGLTLEVERATRLALAGADLAATLDDAPLTPGTSFTVRPGQRLVFRQPRAGLRTYLAFPGGLAAPEVLGSRACTVRERLGGLNGDGQPLAVGDRLGWPGAAPAERRLPEGRGPRMPEPGCHLALVPGAQIAHFSGASLFRAFNLPWHVDNRADRMGVRLTGPALRCSLRGMVSEGIPLGAVQVPADGQPIVLLNDRQTIGGYPRLGALTPSACATLAQCLPGSEVHLAPLSPGQAQEAHLRQLRVWHD
ncbi:biotin-dependent carboxyltransferase family protein [Franzmannia qiaohouensis]|uniref:Biotin-dependent carboxyltransferase family protein n=1 Tax=Franzmannia qiaohouensis TaxID=1329370 RepID=A0ABU1H9A4_9GAMM|nr:biotin-dependent carboxyltransferase family protein [Halomonas qiaohouensis]MDR5904040.1 biotin-dependent carboxyltransferase family protein [Halomonas qiaohouensis]